MHFRIEIGRWWLQVGHDTEPTPVQQEHPGMVLDHPTPQVGYTPERVGFHRFGDEND